MEGADIGGCHSDGCDSWLGGEGTLLSFDELSGKFSDYLDQFIMCNFEDFGKILDWKYLLIAKLSG